MTLPIIPGTKKSTSATDGNGINDNKENSLPRKKTPLWEFQVRMKEGHCLIEHDIKLSHDIVIPSGVYNAQNGMATFPLINISNKQMELCFGKDSLFAELLNFETIDSESMVDRKQNNKMDLKKIIRSEYQCSILQPHLSLLHGKPKLNSVQCRVQ